MSTRRCSARSTGEETPDEVTSEDDGPTLKMVVLRLAAVETALEQLSMGSSALAIAGAVARASEQVALSAGKLNAHVEISTTSAVKTLQEKLQDTFTDVVTSAVEMHAEKLGERISEQTDRKLDVAKETLASLTVLKGEVSRLTSDMVMEAPVKSVADDLDDSRPHHSIFRGL